MPFNTTDTELFSHCRNFNLQSKSNGGQLDFSFSFSAHFSSVNLKAFLVLLIELGVQEFQLQCTEMGEQQTFCVNGYPSIASLLKCLCESPHFLSQSQDSMLMDCCRFLKFPSSESSFGLEGYQAIAESVIIVFIQALLEPASKRLKHYLGVMRDYANLVRDILKDQISYRAWGERLEAIQHAKSVFEQDSVASKRESGDSGIGVEEFSSFRPVGATGLEVVYERPSRIGARTLEVFYHRLKELEQTLLENMRVLLRRLHCFHNSVYLPLMTVGRYLHLLDERDLLEMQQKLCLSRGSQSVLMDGVNVLEQRFMLYYRELGTIMQNEDAFIQAPQRIFSQVVSRGVEAIRQYCEAAEPTFFETVAALIQLAPRAFSVQQLAACYMLCDRVSIVLDRQRAATKPLSLDQNFQARFELCRRINERFELPEPLLPVDIRVHRHTISAPVSSMVMLLHTAQPVPWKESKEVQGFMQPCLFKNNAGSVVA